MSPTKWKYWQNICQVIKEQLRALSRTPIHVAALVAFVLAHCLIHLFTYAEAEEFATPNKEELPKPEIARGLPKRFIPIPDIEIGGCARSDTAHP